MDRYLLFLLCSSGYDTETKLKCQLIIRDTVKSWEIYQTIKEKQQEYQEEAEKKLSKSGFWALSTAISSVSTQRLYLSGHNVMGIDSVNLKLGKDSEISLTWSF